MLLLRWKRSKIVSCLFGVSLFPLFFIFFFYFFSFARRRSSIVKAMPGQQYGQTKYHGLLLLQPSSLSRVLLASKGNSSQQRLFVSRFRWSLGGISPLSVGCDIHDRIGTKCIGSEHFGNQKGLPAVTHACANACSFR